MADEIGDALIGDSEDNAGKFKEFIKKPENIATALVFAAALAQPRQQGRNGFQTLLQRGVGAAAFRGQLERGAQDRAEARQERGFQQSQAQQRTEQQGRQVSAIERQAGTAQQRAQNEAQYYQSQAENQAAELALQREIANDPAIRFQKYSEQAFPRFWEAEVERLQFDPSMADKTAEEIRDIALRNTQLALFSTFQMSQLLPNIGPDGTLDVPDELLQLLPGGGVPQTSGAPAPAPAPAPQSITPPPTERPNPNVAPSGPTERALRPASRAQRISNREVENDIANARFYLERGDALPQHIAQRLVRHDLRFLRKHFDPSQVRQILQFTALPAVMSLE